MRNDEVDLKEIERLNPDCLVFSPGPCTPDEAGITLKAIEQFSAKLPILGVCLGHQAIGQVFGANVIRAKAVKHGKTSQLLHSGGKLFKDVPTPFTATRYHSLVLDQNSLPGEFQVTAWSDEGGQKEIMAIEHSKLPVMGVQFHPESLLTRYGHTILRNFIQATRSFKAI